MIRYSQPDVLNDPFECNLAILESGIDLIDEYEYNFSMLLKGLNIGRESFAYKNFNQQFYEEKVRKLINRKIGILSLSKTKRNLAMWAYYALNHQGFVIGFDHNHPYFHTNGLRDLWDVKKVEYSCRRPARTLVNSHEIDNIFTKSLYWKNEKEYRIIKMLSLADSVIPIREGYPVCLFKFPPEAVKEVVLGEKIDAVTIKNLKKALQNECWENIKILKAESDEKRFKLNFKKYDL